MSSGFLQIETLNSVGLTAHSIFASVFYSFLGLLLMVLFIYTVDRIFDLRFRKELLEDQNTALGVLFAGVAIAVAIVIASAIHG